MLGAEESRIILKSAETEEITTYAVHTATPELPTHSKLVLSTQLGISGSAMSTNECIHTSDAYSDPR